MYNSKKIAVIFSGLLFCGLWLFFTNMVQKKQLEANKKSVDLMMSLAEDNLTKFFKAPLKLEEAQVLSPFTFLLTLDSKSLEPKFFAKNKTFKENLNALSIKSAFKSLNKKSNIFVYESKDNKEASFLVRVFRGGEITRIEGMPLRNIENAMTYAFSDREWFITDNSGRKLLGSSKSEKRLSTSQVAESYNEKTVFFDEYKANIHVVKAKGFSVAIANLFGLFGISLITFSLVSLVSSPLRSENKENFLSTKEGKADLLFDEEFEEDVQMVQLKSDSLRNSNKDSVSIEEAKPIEEQNAKASANIENSGSVSNELDYSEFLMENPILGESSKAAVTPSIQTRPKIVEDSETPPALKGQVVDSKMDFIEDDKLAENMPSDYDDQVNDNINASSEYASVESLEASSEDEWLKLAEELTDSLEEFAQNYDDKIVDQITKDLKV